MVHKSELDSVVCCSLLVSENVHALTLGTCVMCQSRIHVVDQLIWGWQNQHGLLAALCDHKGLYTEIGGAKM